MTHKSDRQIRYLPLINGEPAVFIGDCFCYATGEAPHALAYLYEGIVKKRITQSEAIDQTSKYEYIAIEIQKDVKDQKPRKR